MNSFAEENYLKAIYKIAENSDGYIYRNDLAKMFNSSASSVCAVTQTLAP